MHINERPVHLLVFVCAVPIDYVNVVHINKHVLYVSYTYSYEMIVCILVCTKRISSLHNDVEVGWADVRRSCTYSTHTIRMYYGVRLANTHTYILTGRHAHHY